MSDFYCSTEETGNPNERLIKIGGTLCSDEGTDTAYLFADDVARPLEVELSEAPKALCIIIDLTKLREIDSTGVGALSRIWEAVTRNGGTVEIKGLTGQPAGVFSIFQLGTLYKPVKNQPR